jgi:hypothetical protein
MSLKEVAVHAGHEVWMVFVLHFIHCWWPTRGFRSAAQASPKPLLKIIIIIKSYFIKL